MYFNKIPNIQEYVANFSSVQKKLMNTIAYSPHTANNLWINHIIEDPKPLDDVDNNNDLKHLEESNTDLINNKK